MVWSIISFTDIGAGKLLVVKCSHGLSNWVKKSSLFCFRKCLWLVDLRICFYLKRARPRFWLRTKFNWYSMRFFQRALIGFNNLWIHFIFREFNCVSLSKVPSPIVQMESWTRCLGDCIFSCSRGNRIFFFGTFWNSSIFGLCTTVWIRAFGLQLSFYFSKRVSLCSRYGRFCYNLTRE